MKLAKTYGSTMQGVEAMLITLEVSIGQGTRFFLVGLPDNTIKESQQRIETALKHYGYRMPRQKVVINLAPANIRKEGSSYDLPIALGILEASGQLQTKGLERYLIMGELSLDGHLRRIKGSLPTALMAKKMGFDSFLLPWENAAEAAVVDSLRVIGVHTLQEAIEYLTQKKEIAPTKNDIQSYMETQDHYERDFTHTQGQGYAKRALEIAAAGGHNIAMIGPPGSGKTMMAKCMPSILPPMELEEALETTKIYSVAGKLDSRQPIIAQRPFRSPHHTISDVALVGGGTVPQPGEISLAHHGILYLDELPEFKRAVLEVLRQPLEDRAINISRANASVTLPANFMLVASMNPCPCGYYNHPHKPCTCTPNAIQRYFSRISGPLMDRIDLHIEVNHVPFEQMSSTQKNETSAEIRPRILHARKQQQQRFRDHPEVFNNAMMSAPLVKKVCTLHEEGKKLLNIAMDRLSLSSRSYHRILKVARSIADLADSPDISSEHVAEAIQYRSLDQGQWGSIH